MSKQSSLLSKDNLLFVGGGVALGLALAKLPCLLKKMKKGQEKVDEDAPLIFGGIEMGGTGVVVAIAEGSPLNIIDRHSIRTTSPQETLLAVAAFFMPYHIDALGVASFGPLCLDKNSDKYGFITTTPKPGWADTALVSFLSQFRVPIGLDTDVNAVAVAEFRHSKRGVSCAYVTVGTGVGVGLVIDGQPVHGHSHPEAGHISVPLCESDLSASFKGVCPFHSSCVEGMVSNHSIAARLGCSIDDLPALDDSHPVWSTVAHYLAHLCVNLCLTVAPHTIVLGGGVMQRQALFPLVRRKFTEIVNGYIQIKGVTDDVDSYIVPPVHGAKAGIVGALELAADAHRSSSSSSAPASTSGCSH